ncbi:MAG: hypothetical protein Q8N39_04980 [Pelolinea sp.]|nr:hypothetical protein [Pelolinea sp.]
MCTAADLPTWRSTLLASFILGERAGQRVEAWGGITTAAQSARKAVAGICKANRKRFTASIP